jgi:hypothetical protein
MPDQKSPAAIKISLADMELEELGAAYRVYLVRQLSEWERVFGCSVVTLAGRSEQEKN